jgi:hypothetical protein
LAEYEESVGKTLSSLDGYWGDENSDSRLMAELIVMLADKNDLPPHLLLGSDALTVSKQTEDARTALAEKWRETSKSVDFRPVTSESGNRNPGK